MEKIFSISPAQGQARPAGTQPSQEGNGARCAVCHRPGARWIARLYYGDGQAPERVPVHRPCGRVLTGMAPKGATVKVIPSEELRREWQARAFWSQKLQEARARAEAKAAKKAAKAQV